MADIYGTILEKAFNAEFDLTSASGDIKAMLVSSAYSANVASDGTVNDIPAAARLAYSDAISGLTVTPIANGILVDAPDMSPSWQSVTAGPVTATQMVYYYDDGLGSASSQHLVAHHGSADITNLPYILQGNDVDLTFNASNGLFKIGG